MGTKKIEHSSRCRPYYPTACFELFHATTASYIVGSIQLCLAVLVVVVYVYLESMGFLLCVDCFRPVVASVTSLYAGAIICAMVGVYLERRGFLQLYSTVLTSIMVVTDVIAVSIILIMAIGNRNSFTNQLPHIFVDAKKFYSILGPFWMYLGAITLHLTVAGNMCFLQVFNCCQKYLEDKQSNSLDRPSKEANNN